MRSVEEAERRRWDHTAELIAASINVEAGKLVVSASQINPYRRRQRDRRGLDLADLADYLDPE